MSQIGPRAGSYNWLTRAVGGRGGLRGKEGLGGLRGGWGLMGGERSGLGPLSCGLRDGLMDY